jgi:biopolymer transport protein ExbD
MSAGVGGGDGGQEFELNLASIIDCFTVLIAFMLASASFLAIGVLDAGISAASATTTDAKPPAIQVEITLRTEGKIGMKVTGQKSLNSEFSSEADLMNSIKNLKEQYPDLQSAVLQAEDVVPYKSVVLTMESLRKTVPSILLGGF